MAIQLSDRDILIFKYIEEHKVLLEKHIAWFISSDDKPVLIRDRLRKLFYLDYLLCQRHGGKLPWWTTPTKPLMYMLSPMTHNLYKIEHSHLDLTTPDTQRHLLEIANIRMLMLVDEKAGILNNLVWTTTPIETKEINNVDAMLSFEYDHRKYKVGIVNHPNKEKQNLEQMIEANLANKIIDTIWLISRDENSQKELQKMLTNNAHINSILFATHHELYQAGLVKANWQNNLEQTISASGEFRPIPINTRLDLGVAQGF